MLLSDYRGPKIFRLVPKTAPDSYGDPVEDWSEPGLVRLLGASAQPVSESEEDGVDRVFLADVRRLFVRGRASLTAADRIRIEGEGDWRVDGDPVTRSPLTSGAYTVAMLKRVVGREAAS